MYDLTPTDRDLCRPWMEEERHSGGRFRTIAATAAICGGANRPRSEKNAPVSRYEVPGLRLQLN